MTEDKKSGYKILLLEDEPVICRITARTLGSEGYEVDIAANGLIAKDKLALNQYDLLIFDIRTPAMNGIQLYEYLEKEYPDLAGKVIFTTGDTLGSTTKSFLERVKNVYLSKPYTPTQIRSAVKQAISGIVVNI